MSEKIPLAAILAALRPATPDEREEYALSDESLLGDVEGVRWGFDYEDNGCGSRWPSIFKMVPGGTIAYLTISVNGEDIVPADL